MNIGQAVIAPLETMGQSFMIDAHGMQYGGMKIVYVDRVFNNVVTKLIRFAVRDSTLNAAACKEN